jgi:methylenetetrahydrofolate reductase (NADPH)
MTSIFINHLQSQISATPFSSGPLSAESLLILPQLLALNRRGWWTVGSQPAVDSVSSSDDVVGWGPRNGYVFQKAFVEFFCDIEDVELIAEKADKETNEQLVWFAANNNVWMKHYLLTSTDIHTRVNLGVISPRRVGMS